MVEGTVRHVWVMACVKRPCTPQILEIIWSLSSHCTQRETEA